MSLVTDASQMVGLTSGACRAATWCPAIIAAGCDMFLFFRNADEDFQYMLDGVPQRHHHRASACRTRSNGSWG